MHQVHLSAGGEVAPQAQDDSAASYSQKVVAKDGLLDWSQSAETLSRRVRAYNPWPGCYTTWKGRRLKVHMASAVGAEAASEPGTVVSLSGDTTSVGVVTGAGILRLETVQLEGKRPAPVSDFLRGQSDFINSTLLS